MAETRRNYRPKEEAMGYEFGSDFIQADEHRPKASAIEAGSIPVIDLSPIISGDDQAISAIVEEVGSACKDWGFFLVINHGVPDDLLERIRKAARDFFDLPLEEKQRVKRGPEIPVGYYDGEYTKNVRDWKEVFDFVMNEAPVFPSATEESGQERTVKLRNQWPDYPPDFRYACEEFAKAAEKLSFRLLELVSLSLGLPLERLNCYFEDDTSFARLNRYPPCPEPHLALGVGRHKDSGGLTVLFQDDVGGLDVRRKSDGEWVRVKPLLSSFVINVGAAIQVWSNDAYQSVEHRVAVNLEKERFSIPFFFNPSHDTIIRPLEELTSKESPALYEEYSWGEFSEARSYSNFIKLDQDNVQISDYKKVFSS